MSWISALIFAITSSGVPVRANTENDTPNWKPGTVSATGLNAGELRNRLLAADAEARDRPSFNVCQGNCRTDGDHLDLTGQEITIAGAIPR